MTSRGEPYEKCLQICRTRYPQRYYCLAFCDSDESSKVENYGVIENSEDVLLKVMLKLKKDDSYVLKTVYEAGPTGFGRYV